MKSFTDSLARTWHITVNTATVKRVREKEGLNVLDIFGDQAQALFGDPVKLVDVLWILCGDQARERGISVESFVEGLVGDAVERAADALLEAVIDFFPSSRRLVLNRTVEKSRAMVARTMATALERIDSIDPDKGLPIGSPSATASLASSV